VRCGLVGQTQHAVLKSFWLVTKEKKEWVMCLSLVTMMDPMMTKRSKWGLHSLADDLKEV